MFRCLQVEQGLAAAKIVLTGGNVNIPYFRQRFEQEIRPFIPDIYPVQVDYVIQTPFECDYLHSVYNSRRN